MRGNHIQYGRTLGPLPDRTTAADRERIAGCELREVPDRKWNRDVWKDGRLVGQVRVRADGQWFRLHGDATWQFASFEWGDNDPKWGIAILMLLEHVEDSET